ncbi:MAG: hypothetical protein P8I61_00500 [Opitutae bacterium]|nr:hypothetical protein [Opitutae bacterium]
MKKTKRFSLFNVKITQYSLILACLCISQLAHAIATPLGSLTFTNPTATSRQEAAGETIDGNLGGVADAHGWSTSVGGSDDRVNQAHTISWDISTPTLTLTANESVDYYTYTFSFYYGWDELPTLSSFSLDAQIGESTNYVRITNYDSLTSTLAGQTLTSDEAGIISGNEPGSSTTLLHTMAFRTDSDITNLRANLPPTPSWTGIGHIHFAEITGSATAEVVPEPSTYAFFVGMIAFLFIAYQKRANA